MSSDKVTVGTFPNGWDAYMINGESYTVREDDTAEGFLKISWHYALLAKYLDSPERKEQLRLNARRKEIAKRYGVDHHSSYLAEPTRAMIEAILELEEAAK